MNFNVRIFTSEYIGVSSFFAVLAMRPVVRDKENDGVLLDAVTVQLINDAFNTIVHF